MSEVLPDSIRTTSDDHAQSNLVHDGIDPVRLEKLNELRAAGRDPFSVERYERSSSNHAAVEQFEAGEKSFTGEEGEGYKIPGIKLAGRITSSRVKGKAAFLDLTDASGRIQVYIKYDEIGETLYDDVKHRYDIGDFLGVEGFLFRTRMGEISIHAQSITLLAKSLRSVPYGKIYETVDGNEKHAGALSDTETRYRRRYVDLIVNKGSRDVFLRRIKMIKAIRNLLDSEGYYEVETPVLQTIAGGAAARPFNTHHNTLDLDMHLRISLELYLKRLIVGDIERVYEIGRVFRNEGISTRHNPEFTMLELYQAYGNLDDMMAITEKLFRAACRAVHDGSEKFQYGDNLIDFEKPFEQLSILGGIEKYAGIKEDAFENLESAHKALKSVGLPTENEPTVGGIIEKLHERFTQPNLIQPTFITDFPAETSPLAKKRHDNPKLVRRFEIYAGASELGNAFSEINDPIDQRERFMDQLKLRDAGDPEAHPMDEDFLRAMEYGMPPTGGFGFGIDRLALMLTNAPSIRDVIFFPQLKAEY